MISYLSSIVTTSQSCNISDILLLINKNSRTSRDCDDAH